MVSGKIALIAFLLFSSVYISIACIAKKGISQNSLLILRNNQKLTQLIQEALGSYRDIVIDNSSKIFLAIHKRIDLQARQKEISNQFSAYFPRYVVEGIGFLFIAFIGFWFNMNGDELKNALPTLGFLALASQKLLPSLQSIYSSWALIRGYDKDISILVNLALQSSSPVRDALTQFYGFSESITFQDISFKYQDSSKYALQSINLTIKSGEFVALTGSSGSGKSTLVDILMGLLRPSRGSIIVDSKTILVDEVRPILSGWMKLISHVPQSIYIKDATIAENVAFYDSLDQIDFKHLTHVCRCAEISEYIESLPQRYNSRIGEGGAKLSGGQRQRIGIARALYKNTPLLILDEATSALDRSTEHKILANIANIRPKPTIIMVTHRESTYIFCDKIVTMKGGNVYNA
jgi:ATP-binding cassette subfamily B protein